MHLCKGQGRLEGRSETRLGCGGGKVGGSKRLGQGRRECRRSLLPGPSFACLVGLHRRSPERSRGPRPLFGQLSLSIQLDLQESDRGCQSAGALQDLVKLNRPYSWRLLPRFVGRESLAVLFFVLFLLSTFFRSGVPFPLGPPLSSAALGHLPPTIVSEHSTWPVNIPAKGRKVRPGTSILLRSGDTWLRAVSVRLPE